MSGGAKAKEIISQGTRGIAGPPGPAGPSGSRGIPGRRGIEGPRGRTGLSGAIGAVGPAGKIGSLKELAKQIAYVDRSIDNIYNEMGAHISRMTRLQRELDTLRETVRNLAAAKPLRLRSET